jgi:hypothetical protein
LPSPPFFCASAAQGTMSAALTAKTSTFFCIFGVPSRLVVAVFLYPERLSF